MYCNIKTCGHLWCERFVVPMNILLSVPCWYWKAWAVVCVANKMKNSIKCIQAKNVTPIHTQNEMTWPDLFVAFFKKKAFFSFFRCVVLFQIFRLFFLLRLIMPLASFPISCSASFTIWNNQYGQKYDGCLIANVKRIENTVSKMIVSFSFRSNKSMSLMTICL